MAFPVTPNEWRMGSEQWWMDGYNLVKLGWSMPHTWLFCMPAVWINFIKLHDLSLESAIKKPLISLICRISWTRFCSQIAPILVMVTRWTYLSVLRELQWGFNLVKYENNLIESLHPEDILQVLYIIVFAWSTSKRANLHLHSILICIHISILVPCNWIATSAVHLKLSVFSELELFNFEWQIAL